MGIRSANEIESSNNNKRKKITSNQAVIQTPITNYVSCPLSTQDGLHFCKLFLIMIISDGI